MRPPLRAAPARGGFQLEPFLRAVRRGAAMSVNLDDRWDPWAVFLEPLEALRARYRVPPIDADLDAWR